MNIYAPREIPSDGELLHAPAQIDPSGEILTVEERAAPDPGDRSKVPYYEVIGEYSRAAEEALDREDVPPAYRRTVRDYFDALNSGARRPDEASDSQPDEAPDPQPDEE